MLTRDEISACAALEIGQVFIEKQTCDPIQLVAKIQCIINNALDKQEQENEVEKKICILAGVEFPMPEQEPLQIDEIYWAAKVNNSENRYTWQDDPIDNEFLRTNIVHKTQEGAIAQRDAIIAAIAEAVANAK